MADQTYTRDEVAKHTTEDSLWCIIDSKVYDLTDFVDAHPGGEAVLQQVAGKDATRDFYNLHRHEVLTKYKRLVVGTIKGEKPEVVTPKPGDLSEVPYAEPMWLSKPFRSPYYNESHKRLQKAIRVWVDEELVPEAQECETTGRFVSQEMIERMSQLGILHMRLGPGKHLHGVELMGGVVKGEEFDYFHDLIVGQEMSRANARGFQDGNMAGMVIGLTAVLNFAKDEAWKKKIADEVFSGKKKACLAITEAFAGMFLLLSLCGGRQMLTVSYQAPTLLDCERPRPRLPMASTTYDLVPPPYFCTRVLTSLTDRQRNQEVDHERRLQRLLHHGRQHGQGSQRPPDRARRGR